MKTVLVSISYCAEHAKGADPWVAPRVPGQEHAEWLEEAACHYCNMGFCTMVAATAWRGMINVHNSPDSCERDVMWRIVRRGVMIHGVPENPGHQVGAALCIRQGLEAAQHLGYDYLVHTAEDVVPSRLAISDMANMLDRGFDYVGEAWGVGGAELNAQFFACRALALVGRWDPCEVTGHGCIEKYLQHCLEGRSVLYRQPGSYRTTHDHSEWRRWLQEVT